MARTKTSVHALHLRAGVSIGVINRALEGRASLASALKISFLTGREVPYDSMTPARVSAGVVRELRRKAVR